MRKKSHVSLAGYITGHEVDITHKAAFKFGSLAPDLVPSFITKKHEIEGTFNIVHKKMGKVLDSYENGRGLTMIETKDLGVITHYLADYFTFPHNKEYTGSLKDHVMYEKELKYALKDFIKSVDVDLPIEYHGSLSSIEEICAFIKRCHAEYIRHIKNIQNDCRHIVQICTEVIAALLNLIRQKVFDVAIA